MAGKRKAGTEKRGTQEVPPPDEMVARTLSAALVKQEDFIITFETTDEGISVMHVMTGELITPCMLGTLSNRCDLPGQEQNRHLVLKLS